MVSGEHCRYYRGLEIISDLCVGCSHCMRVCPTEALRVNGGKLQYTPISVSIAAVVIVNVLQVQ